VKSLRLALLVILLASPAMAQDAPAPVKAQDIIANTIGNLDIANANMSEQIGALTKQIAALKAQLADAQKAAPKPAPKKVAPK
jgi:uncharacterized small protein (DUF1192 family)